MEICDVLREKGTAAFYKASGNHSMLACQYRSHKDKSGSQQKVVYMLSTCHAPSTMDTGKKNSAGNMIMIPQMVRGYNIHMGGVNRVGEQFHNLDILQK